MRDQELIHQIQQTSFPLEPMPTGTTERLSHLENIRVVLFDVYGTLFISGSGDISVAGEMSNQQALTDALQDVGFSGNLEEAGLKGCKQLLRAIHRTHAAKKKDGISFPEVDIREEWQTVLNSLYQEGLLQGTVSSEAVQQVGVGYECRINPVWPMPDVLSTLQRLKQKQFLLGIVSNAQFYTLLIFPALLKMPLKELGFHEELCVWSYQLGEAKPSVNMFQGVAEHLQTTYNISPEEILYVGNDMLNDVWTASQCGLKTVLFAGDRRSLRLRKNDPRCADIEPDAAITKLPQLVDVLGA